MAFIPATISTPLVAALFGFGVVSGVAGTRVFYKAGQVDALREENETLREIDGLKDEFMGDVKEIVGSTQAIMEDLSAANVELSLRQPVNTNTIREITKDAPDRYAAFDPNQCLRYVYPDGMLDDLDRQVRTITTTLPRFDNSGRRITGTSE